MSEFLDLIDLVVVGQDNRASRALQFCDFLGQGVDGKHCSYLGGMSPTIVAGSWIVTRMVERALACNGDFSPRADVSLNGQGV